jgi:hypothetical protein
LCLNFKSKTKCLNLPSKHNNLWILVFYCGHNKLLIFNYESNQQDALYRLIYYSKSALHVSGNVFAYHREHLTVFTVSCSVHPSCCRLVSWMSSNAGPYHPRHQQAATWVNTTGYCKYSQVLLMMDKNTARNMYSRLGIIN